MTSGNHITAESLLGRKPQGWHDGSEILTYSFLSDTMPDYVKTKDTNGDGIADIYKITGFDKISVEANFAMNPAEQALARRAVGAWNDVANINLQEGTNDGVAGDITLGSAGFSDGGFGFISAFPRASSLGVSDTRGDLWVNSNNPDQAVNEIGHTSWNTYLHELGHSLGLRHPNEDPNNYVRVPQNNNRYTVMSYNPHPAVRGESVDDQPWPLTPMIYDIQAVQQLYGANTDTRGGDTSYFGAGDAGSERAYQYGADGMTVSGRDVILTLWDGGGVDLIDVTDLDVAVTVDLRAGKFSTIGEVANNIAMALAVRVEGKVVNLIENLWGTAQDDRVRGNSADNALLGGGGNDRLKGARGDDALNGGLGQDRLQGGQGADVFIFDAAKNEGRDRIVDFTDGVDMLEISNGGFAGVEISPAGGGADTRITLAGGTEILLKGIESSLIDADDFNFV